MAGTDDGGARRREPLVLGISGALIGVVLAVALVAFLGLGGTGPAGASGSPAALSSASVPPSLAAIGSPSIAPTAPPPSAEVTIAPATVAPTAVPTTRPTPRPTRTPSPAPTLNTNPTITKFSIPSLVDCTAGAATIHISWTIRRATGVTLSIDGGGLYQSYSGTSGSDDVPFGCDAGNRTHTYTLRTTGGNGPAASITKSVKWGAMTIVSFSMGQDGSANCPTASGTVGIDLSYVLKYATGAELERDGQLYATYSEKVVDTTGIAYQCSKDQQVFTLTTTGGYGAPDTSQITIHSGVP